MSSLLSSTWAVRCPAGSASIWGGVAGCEEKRKEEDTEGNEETDSPDGLEGDGSELRGDPGCESERGAVLLKSDKPPIGTVRCSGTARTVSKLVPGIGISILVKKILKPE